MLPTLNMRGDVLIVDRLSHHLGKLELGDVVLVKSPQNPRRILTKRVLGMEGDVVSFNAHTGNLKTLVVSFLCNFYIEFECVVVLVGV